MADENAIVVDLGDDDTAAKPAADPSVVVITDDQEADEKLPKGAVLQEDGSVVLPLRFPVTMSWRSSKSGAVREERRDSFRFYRLNGEAMEALMNSGGSTVKVGLAKSCRMQQALFNAFFARMDGADINAAGQVLSFLLNSGGQPPSGPSVSP